MSQRRTPVSILYILQELQKTDQLSKMLLEIVLDRRPFETAKENNK